MSYQLLQPVFLHPNRLGNHFRIQARQRSPGYLKRHLLSKPAETQESKPMIVEPLDSPASSTSRVRDAIHPGPSLAFFPNEFLLPHPDDEILSGYEDDVSSMRDGCTAWVKAAPASILESHLVNLNSANPAFRQAQDRKYWLTDEEYRFDTDVPNRLTEQKRLSIYNWKPGPRRGKEESIEKHIAGKWHIIALQEAIEHLDHEYLTNRFFVTHYYCCAVLFNKDTLHPDINLYMQVLSVSTCDRLYTT